MPSGMSQVAEDYADSLSELDQNKKPLINMLTMLAEEEQEHANEIVKVIESHLARADEKTRGSLYKLRHTWTNIFSGARLYAIDIRVNSVDPNWPIVSPARVEGTAGGPTIHVNPNFFKNKDSESAPEKSGEERKNLRDLEEKKKKLEEEKAKILQREKAGPKIASVVTVPTDRDPRKQSNNNNNNEKETKSKKNKRSHESSRDSSIEMIKRISRRSKSPDKSKSRSKDKSRTSKDSPSSSSKESKEKVLPLKKRRIGTDVTEPISSGSETEFQPTKPIKVETFDEEVRRNEDLRILLSQSPPRVSPPRVDPDLNTTGNGKMNRIPKISVKKEVPPYDPMHRGIPTPTAQPGTHAFQTVLVPPQPQQPVMRPPQPQPMHQSRSMGLLPPPGQGFGPMYPPGQRPRMNAFAQRPPMGDRPDPSNMIPANNRIYVDGRAYEVQYIDDIAVIERNGLPHKIYFSGPPRDVVIDTVAHSLSFNETKTITIDGQSHIIRFGAPSKELFMGNHAFRGAFGGPAIFAMINGVRHEIRLCGPPPEVKIDPEPCYELLRHMPHQMPSMPRGFAYDFGSSVAPPPPPQNINIAQIGLPPQEPCVQPQVDVNTLLENLLKTGVLRQGEHPKINQLTRENKGGFRRSPARPITPPIPSQHCLTDDISVERRTQPPITLKEFSMRSLKIRYASVVDCLYSTLKKSCPHCGLRFDDTQSQKYARHLDWHFADSNRSQEARAISRPWCLIIDDWVEYSETGDENSNKSKSSIFEAQSQANAEVLALQEPVVEASSGVEACTVCGEDFDSFFDEEEDVWKLKNAIISNNRVCHPLCAQDMSVNPAPDHQNSFFSALDGASDSYGLPGLANASASDQLVLAQHTVKTELVDENEESQVAQVSEQTSRVINSDSHNFLQNMRDENAENSVGIREVKSEPNFDNRRDSGKSGPGSNLPDKVVQAMVMDADYSDEEEEEGNLDDLPFFTSKHLQSPGTPLRDETE